MRSHHLHCFLQSLLSSWPGKGWLLHRREPQRSRVSMSLASRWPLVCRKAPAGRAGSHLHTCPNTTAAVLVTGECLAPPPRPSPHHQDKEPAKICMFPRAGLQRTRLSQNVSDTWVFVKTMQANASHISCTGDLSPPQTEGTGFPDQQVLPSSMKQACLCWPNTHLGPARRCSTAGSIRFPRLHPSDNTHPFPMNHNSFFLASADICALQKLHMRRGC